MTPLAAFEEIIDASGVAPRVEALLLLPGAERGFATAKDPATSDISRGWCRLMGLTPLMLFTTILLIARNQRILHAWNARQQDNQRRAAQGLPPRTRHRRRTTFTPLAATAKPP